MGKSRLTTLETIGCVALVIAAIAVTIGSVIVDKNWTLKLQERACYRATIHALRDIAEGQVDPDALHE